MKPIKEYVVNEGANVRWYPEDYIITENEDAIEMISDLFSASTAPQILADALEENFDIHCFSDDKWLKALGKSLGDIVNDIYDEKYNK